MSESMSMEKLLAIKKRIEKAESTVAELNGKKAAIEEQLKSQFRLESIDEAKEQLDGWDRESEKLDSEISDLSARIEKKLNEIDDSKG